MFFPSFSNRIARIQTFFTKEILIKETKRFLVLFLLKLFLKA